MHIAGYYAGLLMQKAAGAAGNATRVIIPWRKEGLSLLENILVYAIS